MAVTIYEIAKAAGVSVSTVSRALSDSGHRVNEDTRQHIQEIAKKLGYRPNLVARGLTTDRTFTIGIIVDDISTAFSPLITRGIQDYLRDLNYFSILINSDWDPERETEAIHQMISRSIDGVIFVESWMRGPNPILDLANKPYVFVHRLFSGTAGNSVLVDERFGAHAAVEHLVTLGHRRIAYINGPQHGLHDWDASTERLASYRDVLERSGIPYDPALVEEGNWEVPSGYSATQRFLSLTERPTAIFAANDLMAVGAIYAINDAGLRVPQDIAVVGYDDRAIATIARPALTTVSLPCYQMGQVSAELLLNRLENQVDLADPIRVRGQLIVRESCGAARR